MSEKPFLSIRHRIGCFEFTRGNHTDVILFYPAFQFWGEKAKCTFATFTRRSPLEWHFFSGTGIDRFDAPYLFFANTNGQVPLLVTYLRFQYFDIAVGLIQSYFGQVNAYKGLAMRMAPYHQLNEYAEEEYFKVLHGVGVGDEVEKYAVFEAANTAQIKKVQP